MKPLIERVPGVCGGAAVISGTRIPVWTIISFKRAGLSDKAILATYPSLNLKHLGAAEQYYAEHPIEVEVEIERKQQ